MKCCDVGAVLKQSEAIYDPSKCIRRPEAALVRGSDGDERVEFLLPIVEISEKAWASAFDAAAGDMASQLLRRGGHGRALDELRTNLLAHLDRSEMATWLGQEFVRRLARDISAHLKLTLDLRGERVDASPSGLMAILMLTMRLTDAATVFNCVASVDSAGRIEHLRDRTASLRHFEWGLLLHLFIGCIHVVSGKKGNVYSRLFRELRKDGAVREAMTRGLDQKGLKAALYGDCPLDMDVGRRSVH